MIKFKDILFYIIMFAALIITIITFPSCKEIQYVPVHTSDTVLVSKIERDSVFVKDSTYVITRNDTVFFTKYIDRFKYIDKIDTVYKSSTDTLTVVKKEIVEKEVEKKLGIVYRVLILFGLLFLILIILKLLKIFKYE